MKIGIENLHTVSIGDLYSAFGEIFTYLGNAAKTAPIDVDSVDTTELKAKLVATYGMESATIAWYNASRFIQMLIDQSTTLEKMISEDKTKGNA